MQSLEQASRSDLSRHQRVAGTEIFNGSEHLPELAHKDLSAIRLGKRSQQFGWSFLFECDQSERYFRPTNRLCDEGGVSSLACNQNDRLAGVIGRRQEG